MDQIYLVQHQEGRILFTEEELKHLIKVLRFRAGDLITATDGKGTVYELKITCDDIKNFETEILSTHTHAYGRPPFHLAIAPTKNLDRLEWLCEKATELGIKTIWPIITNHSERRILKLDRLQKILVSGMKQSKQFFLPTLHEAQPFKKYLNNYTYEQKFIAVTQTDIAHHFSLELEANKGVTVLIGPEGDFDQEEIALAHQAGFKSVSLGLNRLRTETAAVHAISIFNSKNLI
jgi:16S rRNA (uracil1498-N3)-methyltransferase